MDKSASSPDLPASVEEDAPFGGAVHEPRLNDPDGVAADELSGDESDFSTL